MLMDSKVPWTKKALLIFGIIYLVLPVDLIPPVLFPIGFLDDLVLWAYIIWHLADDLDKYADYSGYGKEGDLSKNYRRKDIVEDVTFDVKEETNADEENE
ncbi:MAG: DUF1232 domain-containing protein [Firmicutes bacterium]|nr:DUF1232 domain-containing protein [Bacillota bacterium]